MMILMFQINDDYIRTFLMFQINDDYMRTFLMFQIDSHWYSFYQGGVEERGSVEGTVTRWSKNLSQRTWVMIRILWSQQCPWRQCQIWRQDWGAPTETGKALLGDPGWSWGRRYHRFFCLHSKQVDHQWWWSIIRRGWKFVAANLSISMCHPRLSGGSSIWVDIWQPPTSTIISNDHYDHVFNLVCR